MHSLRHIQRLTDCDTANILPCDVNTCLDYCNALLYCIFAKNVQQLQRIWNSLVSYMTYHVVDLPLTHLRLFAGYWSQKRSHTRLQLSHWTLCTYLTELIHDSAPIWSLHSPDRHLLQQPRTSIVTASRAFAVAALGIENSLPASISASRLLLYILNRS